MIGQLLPVGTKCQLTTHCTQMLTLILFLIECAVQPEKRMHSNVITEAILDRLQGKAFI